MSVKRRLTQNIFSFHRSKGRKFNSYTRSSLDLLHTFKYILVFRRTLQRNRFYFRTYLGTQIFFLFSVLNLHLMNPTILVYNNKTTNAVSTKLSR